MFGTGLLRGLYLAAAISMGAGVAHAKDAPSPEGGLYGSPETMAMLGRAKPVLAKYAKGKKVVFIAQHDIMPPEQQLAANAATAMGIEGTKEQYAELHRNGLVKFFERFDFVPDTIKNPQGEREQAMVTKIVSDLWKATKLSSSIFHVPGSDVILFVVQNPDNPAQNMISEMSRLPDDLGRRLPTIATPAEIFEWIMYHEAAHLGQDCKHDQINLQDDPVKHAILNLSHEIGADAVADAVYLKENAHDIERAKAVIQSIRHARTASSLRQPGNSDIFSQDDFLKHGRMPEAVSVSDFMLSVRLIKHMAATLAEKIEAAGDVGGNFSLRGNFAGIAGHERGNEINQKNPLVEYANIRLLDDMFAKIDGASYPPYAKKILETMRGITASHIATLESIPGVKSDKQAAEWYSKGAALEYRPDVKTILQAFSEKIDPDAEPIELKPRAPAMCDNIDFSDRSRGILEVLACVPRP